MSLHSAEDSIIHSLETGRSKEYPYRRLDPEQVRSAQVRRDMAALLGEPPKIEDMGGRCQTNSLRRSLIINDVAREWRTCQELVFPEQPVSA